MKSSKKIKNGSFRWLLNISWVFVWIFNVFAVVLCKREWMLCFESKVSRKYYLITRLKIMTCSRLLKTGCNNVVLPTLFIVVNNIVQHCWAWISPQSGVTMLNNIVDNYEQCGQHNIVASCFQQPWTSYNFLPCSDGVVHSSAIRQCSSEDCFSENLQQNH